MEGLKLKADNTERKRKQYIKINIKGGKNIPATWQHTYSVPSTQWEAIHKEYRGKIPHFRFQIKDEKMEWLFLPTSRKVNLFWDGGSLYYLCGGLFYVTDVSSKHVSHLTIREGYGLWLDTSQNSSKHIYTLKFSTNYM